MITFVGVAVLIALVAFSVWLLRPGGWSSSVDGKETFVRPHVAPLHTGLDADDVYALGRTAAWGGLGCAASGTDSSAASRIT